MFDFLNNLKVENRHDEKILQSIAEIENELNEKKYGLVWEEHSEQVDEMMVDNVPIFLEDKSREIATAGDDSYNFLIEGDNLHSLNLLEKTHHEK
ncbi:MAG: site-specific DNA-methyltransferase, partial [Methanomicrobia archaeon]|nr:site-specific DNA-methyltransferase [Methanomicrobia archaeon]